MNPTTERLYTFQFFLLLLSNVLFSASFGMILPELPAHLASLGGEDYKGLIIGLFTLTAGISRPISGKLTDLIGRVPIMIIGSVVCVVCSLCYPFVTSVFGFLFLRLVHGFSTGFKPTASTAYIGDIVPDLRRGEAMGVSSISGNFGLSGGPILGSFLATAYSIDVMFYVSSAFAVISIIIILGMRETLPEKQPFRPGMLLLRRKELVLRKALPPAVVTFFMYLPYGAILTIIPDQCDYLGIENKGMVYASFTACSMLSRLVAGKVSDRYGRIPVIIVSSVAAALSLAALGFSGGALMLYITIGLAGFALGIGGPALFAWTIDIAGLTERGKAMGTIFIFLEAAIGTGAVVSAWLYANDHQNFSLAFLVTAGITALTIPFLGWYKTRLERTE